VADKGFGIPEKDIERIFERFYRIDKGRSREKGGTGLGLSIVKHIASQHGGSVSVSSVEGEGSVFTLMLPK
jgi:two-component system sensor histidine kinase SenX3